MVSRRSLTSEKARVDSGDGVCPRQLRARRRAERQRSERSCCVRQLTGGLERIAARAMEFHSSPKVCTANGRYSARRMPHQRDAGRTTGPFAATCGHARRCEIVQATVRSPPRPETESLVTSQAFPGSGSIWILGQQILSRLGQRRGIPWGMILGGAPILFAADHVHPLHRPDTGNVAGERSSDLAEPAPPIRRSCRHRTERPHRTCGMKPQ